ncbi:MAG: hypothetical protein Q8P39_03575, partial [Candidatus Yanofskybacteria bacterium]|nr:hypothetical protein [Candidatus Yanofskybacteria bacterium]
VRDFLANHSPRLFRLLVAKTHYRSPLDYSEELLAQAERELERIDEFVDRLRKKAHSRLVPDKDVSLSGTRMAIVRNKFWKALDDDFNTPLALSVLFDLIREMNAAMDKGTISGVAAKDILAFLKEADTTFGFITWGRKKQKRVPAEIKILAERREAHRKQGNWEEADAIRAQLQSRGWSVEDTALGPKLKRQ